MIYLGLLALSAGADPIHDYARSHNLAKVKEFIEQKGVRVDRRETSVGWSVLHIAAQEGDLEIMRYVLSKKANVNILNNYGNPPLEDAVMANQLEAVRLLLDSGADLSLGQDPNYPSYLHTLSDKNDVRGTHLKIMQLLIERGADAKVTCRGTNLLHSASQAGSTSSAEYLVNTLKFDVNGPDPRGTRPLHFAAIAGQSKMTRWLLEHKADPNATTNEGSTAMHKAAALGYAGVVKALLEGGADRTLKNKAGKTALDLAVALGKTEAAALLKTP